MQRRTFLAAASASLAAPKPSLFARDNLVAWCIVPFDARKRGPLERAQMLQRLGLTRLAYDWRDNHIPTFDQELDALNQHGIKLEAFWLSTSADPAQDKRAHAVLDFLRRRKVRTQIWLSVSLPREAANPLEPAASAVGWVAREAQAIGCSVGIYNHGGWYGEPDNQIAMIRKLKRKNLGIVYNFHHAHEHIDRFGGLFSRMLPYLMAVNLNGMKKEGPKILPIGDGDRELEMIRIVARSRFRGTIGILNHLPDVDAEVGLGRNIQGLRKLLEVMGDRAALATY